MKRLATIIGGVLAVLATVYVLDLGWTAAAALADPLTVGVLVGGLVASLFVGELARVVRMPRVVGYLLVGVVIGPVAARFTNRTSLELPNVVTLFSEFEAILTGAAALVGLAVGLRFRGANVRASLRNISIFAMVPSILVVGATLGVLFVAQQHFPSVFLASAQFSWLLAIVIGLLLATSSASAVWGINSEFHAEGSFSDTEIQVSLLKDGAIALGIVALAGARLFDRAGSAGFSEWIASTGTELGLAVAAGLGTGLLLLAVLRWIASEIVPVGIFIAILIGLIVPEFPGLAFIGGAIAGAIVASSSGFSHALSESLDRGSPITLSVVVLHVGLLLDLPVAREVWILGAALFAARFVAIILGGYIATRLCNLPDITERLLPGSILPQGLCTVLLAGFAMQAIPEASGVLFVLAPVLLFDAIIGPIVQRASLVRLGHHRPAHEDVAAPRKRRGQVRRSVLSSAKTGGLDAENSLLPPVDFTIPDFGSPTLEQLAERVHVRLERTMDRVAAGYFDARRGDIEDILDVVRRTIRRHVRDTVEALRRQTDPDRRIQLLRERRAELDRTFLELFRGYGNADTENLGDTLDTVFRDLQRIGDLPPTIQAPEIAELWTPEPNDTRWVRFRKFIHRLSNRLGPPPTRAIPVRAVGQLVLVQGAIARLEPAVNMIGQNRLYLWHKIEIAWSQLDTMYGRCLDRIDHDAGRTVRETLPSSENEEADLLEFDRRLAEGEAARPPSEIAETDGTHDELLHDDQEVLEDPIAAFWRGKLEELSFEHEQLEADVEAYERDTRRRTALAFSAAFQDFVWSLQRAGTFLLPTRALAPRGIEFRPNAEERAHHAGQHWRALVNSHLDRRAMRLQLRILQSDLHPILDRAVERVSRELASHLTYYPAEISERCTEVVSGLSQSIEADVSIADLLDAVTQLRVSMAKFLQDDALHSLHELRQTHRFSELLSEFTAELSALIARQPDVFSLPSHDLLAIPETASAEHVDHVAIPFRQVLERSFLSTISTSLNELDLSVRSTIDRTASGLGEVNRVVSFNLDAAASELRGDVEDTEATISLVSEFAVGGLRRAGQSAAELLTTIQEEIDWIEASLVEISVAHLHETRDLLLDDNVTSLAARAQQVSAEPLPARGLEALETARSSASRLIGKASEPLSRLLETAEQRLAFDEGSYSDLQHVGQVATFEHEALMELPNGYRRLFAPVPVEIPEIFVERPEARENINRAIARWRNGGRTALVVTGESGVGSTSFMHRVLAEELSEVQMVRWNVRERVTTERDLAEQLASLFGMRHVYDVDRLVHSLRDVGSDRLVLIDGLERLYLRGIDGAGAMRALLTAIARAPANIIWIASCGPALFKHLDIRLGIGDLFTDVISLGTFGRDELEDLIMKRHLVSGYDLHFLDHDGPPQSGELREKSQVKLRRRYFDRLFDLTRGYPRIALYYWLESLEQTDVEDTLVARPPKALRTGHVRHLDHERLIALAHVLLHQTLAEADMAVLERIDVEEARRRLAYLENLGLLERSASRHEEVTVNEVIHHDISRALHERNII